MPGFDDIICTQKSMLVVRFVPQGQFWCCIHNISGSLHDWIDDHDVSVIDIYENRLLLFEFNI